MKFSMLVLALLSLSGGACLAASTETEQSCDSTAPPPESSKNSLHGLTLSVFPQKITPDFTGCQSAWVDDHRLIQSQYVNGILHRLEAVEPGREPEICEYTDMNGVELAQQPSSSCKSKREDLLRTGGIPLVPLGGDRPPHK